MFGKIFDLIVLKRYADHLFTSDLQFGFKAKRSTNMCSMVLKECISSHAGPSCVIDDSRSSAESLKSTPSPNVPYER